MSTMTPEALRQAGLDALRRDLGAAGMVRFLQQFEMGQGDYTAERWQWLDPNADVDSLASAIQRTGPEHGRRARTKRMNRTRR
jgi:hypothetical protein